MTTLRQTLEQARDALKAHCGGRCNAEYNHCADLEIADSLTAALASLEAPEPIAWYDEEVDSAYTKHELDGCAIDGLTPLYAHPIDTSQERVRNEEESVHVTRWTERAHPQATEPAPSTEGEQEALPMDTAPTDGTMIRLLVDFEGNSLEDTDQSVWTIGACYASDSQGDVWQFAGWNWSHDCFTEGHGKPIGWLPMLGALLSAPALPVGELTTFEDWAKAEGLDKDLNFTPTRLPPPARHYMHIQTNQLWMAWNAGLAAARTQPVREPLTNAQIEEGRKATFSTDNPFCPCDSKTMRKAVWWAERAHGITQGGKPV